MMLDIKGYEGLYAVTEDGQVWSYRRKKFLVPNGSKYKQVTLSKNGEKKFFAIHYLVLTTFKPCENMSELTINHKNEIKTDNRLENLEWLSQKDNDNYGTRNERISKTHSIPVYCVELDKIFESGKVAAEALGLQRSHICRCCKDSLRTTGGFHFQYAEHKEVR